MYVKCLLRSIQPLLVWQSEDMRKDRVWHLQIDHPRLGRRHWRGLLLRLSGELFVAVTVLLLSDLRFGLRLLRLLRSSLSPLEHGRRSGEQAKKTERIHVAAVGGLMHGDGGKLGGSGLCRILRG